MISNQEFLEYCDLLLIDNEIKIRVVIGEKAYELNFVEYHPSNKKLYLVAEDNPIEKVEILEQC